VNYTIEKFAEDCRCSLDRYSDPTARAALCGYVKRACQNHDFLSTHFSDENNSPRNLLYEDKVHGFCILTHVYEGTSNGKPHDHGPSWAIYGQATGNTKMTEWQIVDGELVAIRSYDLGPGDVYLYNEGVIHSPQQLKTTRLIRIEGINLHGVTRAWYDFPLA